MQALKTLAFVVLSVFIVCGVASAVLVGSAHDFNDNSGFNSDGWNDENGGPLCGPCHTPHNAVSAVVPLWSHQPSSATYTMYSNSVTLQASMPAEPSAMSKACLSCHDGTVALEAFAGVVTTNATKLTGPAMLGNDLSTSHPISFKYDAALFGADSGLKDPSGGSIAPLLFAEYLECASCHDPHNTPGIAKMLRVSNAGSALCTTCHSK